MHTATELVLEDFDVEIDGSPSTREDLLPRWDSTDRLGVVVQQSLGALGASNLIQLAITAFYDGYGSPLEHAVVYPDIYLFHVGRRHGCYAAFDFLPIHKEVVVEPERGALVRAVADRAVTRLVLDGVTGAGAGLSDDENRARLEGAERSAQADVSSVRQRLRSAYGYSPDGDPPKADVTIRSRGAACARNAERVLYPERFIEEIERSRSGSLDAGAAGVIRQIRASSEDVDPTRLQLARARYRTSVQQREHVEHYRRMSVAAATARLLVLDAAAGAIPDATAGEGLPC